MKINKFDLKVWYVVLQRMKVILIPWSKTLSIQFYETMTAVELRLPPECISFTAIQRLKT